jgi:hypothetical protein
MAISKINTNSIAPSQTLVTPVISGLMDLQGGQIKFPSSQLPSSDANTLDDYEEGTWTPTVGGNATYIARAGTYVKIGRLVYIDYLLRVNILGTGSTSVISGLPFTAGAGSVPRSAGSLSYAAALAQSVYSISTNVDGNGIQFETFSALSSGTYDGAPVIGNGAYVIGSATYYTSA